MYLLAYLPTYLQKCTELAGQPANRDNKSQDIGMCAAHDTHTHVKRAGLTAWTFVDLRGAGRGLPRVRIRVLWATLLWSQTGQPSLHSYLSSMYLR